MKGPTKPGQSDKTEVLFSKYEVSATLDESVTLYSIRQEVEKHVMESLDVNPDKVDVPELVWNTGKGRSTITITVNGYEIDDSVPHLEATIHTGLEDNWNGYKELHNVLCVEMIDS